MKFSLEYPEHPQFVKNDPELVSRLMNADLETIFIASGTSRETQDLLGVIVFVRKGMEPEDDEKQTIVNLLYDTLKISCKYWGIKPNVSE